jgi:P27 family predicted phage terminase small subunit
MTTEEKQKIYSGGDFRSLTDAQKRIFRLTVEDLDARGLLRPTDASIIASYSRNVILARLASKELEKHGVLIAEVDKYHGTKLKQNPAADILQRAQKAMEDTAIKLGLTPTGRKRLRGDESTKTASEAWDEQED